MKSKSISSGQPESPEKKYKPPIQINPDHKEFLSIVGNRLEEIREAKGISITELCKKVKISRFGYYLIKDSQVYWNSQTLLKILKYFEIDAIKFFTSMKKRSVSKKIN